MAQNQSFLVAITCSATNSIRFLICKAFYSPSFNKYDEQEFDISSGIGSRQDHCVAETSSASIDNSAEDSRPIFYLSSSPQIQSNSSNLKVHSCSCLFCTEDIYMNYGVSSEMTTASNLGYDKIKGNNIHSTCNFNCKEYCCANGMKAKWSFIECTNPDYARRAGVDIDSLIARIKIAYNASISTVDSKLSSPTNLKNFEMDMIDMIPLQKPQKYQTTKSRTIGREDIQMAASVVLKGIRKSKENKEFRLYDASKSIRMQIEFIFSSSGRDIFAGCILRNPLNIENFDILVYRTVPDQAVVKCGAYTRFTWDYDEDVDKIDKYFEKDIAADDDKSEENREETKQDLNPPIQRLRELILSPLLHPEQCKQCGITFPHGILLYGPPGVGKTHSIRMITNEYKDDIFLQVINVEDLSFSRLGEAEEFLRNAFEAASQRLLDEGSGKKSGKYKISILFLDELDSYASHRDGGAGQRASESSKLVAQLLTLMDGISKKKDGLIVIGATNRQDDLDPALRRPGRFDVEIHFPVPSSDDRFSLLHQFLKPYLKTNEFFENSINHFNELTLTNDIVRQMENMSLENKATYQRIKKFLKEEISDKLTGYVPADLVRFVRQTVSIALKKQTANITESNIISSSHLLIALNDAPRASSVSSSGHSLSFSKADTSNLSGSNKKRGWDSIGGMYEAKKRLQYAIEWPLTRKDMLKKFGIRSCRGVLLHGPPGCAKTSLVRACAESIPFCAFFALSSADIYSCYVGEAERRVRQIFSIARAATPSIMFLDEIDMIVGNRGNQNGSGSTESIQNRVLSTLLNEMDGVENSDGLIVVGATNRIDCVDAALLRPGRFDEIIQIQLPDIRERIDILQIHLNKMSREAIEWDGVDKVDIEKIAAVTEGLAGVHLAAMCKEASIRALRRCEEIGAELNQVKVTQNDFNDVLRKYL